MAQGSGPAARGRAEITLRRIIQPVPGSDRVSVVRNVPYAPALEAPLTLDLYRPPDAQAGTRTPAVVFVTGYPDAGMREVLGCAPRDMASCISWAELIAVSGMTAVTYAAADPAVDATSVLDFLRAEAARLGIDPRRVGIWACSGNVPAALGVLMGAGPEQVRCAAFLYGYMLDLEGSSAVADAAASFRFVNPCTGRGIEHLPAHVPVFVARAGADQMPGLNESIDAFVAASLRHARPISLVNCPGAPHAFDIMDDRECTRAAIAQTVAFLRAHLV